jgi:hypothetical protein
MRGFVPSFFFLLIEDCDTQVATELMGRERGDTVVEEDHQVWGFAGLNHAVAEILEVDGRARGMVVEFKIVPLGGVARYHGETAIGILREHVVKDFSLGLDPAGATGEERGDEA